MASRDPARFPLFTASGIFHTPSEASRFGAACFVSAASQRAHQFNAAESQLGSR